MAAKSRSDIIGDVEDFVDRNGGNFADFFVGVTGAPKQMLFSQHKLKDKGDAWISRLAKDELDAHDVVEYFRSTRGAKSRKKEVVETDLYVYAFKIKPHTRT
ncbi:conserved hypothetical protein [Magnetospirillum sp. LM-5]|uniref:hypothetical protein n=1 Tax=Magnetospirillum sp. LM-5 TaxID=2681466 RepID=UPI00138068A8|nr:hypothetical protein [Magnetospirillum sp. LM-5]CAA7624710.1 conserved hypothetical protein [Magnetospirillum sp. LM-5]